MVSDYSCGNPAIKLEVMIKHGQRLLACDSSSKMFYNIHKSDQLTMLKPFSFFLNKHPNSSKTLLDTGNVCMSWFIYS